MLSTFKLQSPCVMSLHFIHWKQHFFRDINSFTKYSKIQSYCWSIRLDVPMWRVRNHVDASWTAVMQGWCTASAIVVKQWGMVATSDQLLFFSLRPPSTPVLLRMDRGTPLLQYLGCKTSASTKQIVALNLCSVPEEGWTWTIQFDAIKVSWALQTTLSFSFYPLLSTQLGWSKGKLKLSLFNSNT